MTPRYPNITVRLTGTDGNAFSVLGRVIRAMRQNHVPDVDVDQFTHEANSGDYDHLLRTVMGWVEVS